MAGIRCDAASLDAEAEALRAQRAAWRNDSGIPLRQAERARTALEAACPSSVLAPYEEALAEATESSREGRPLARREGDDAGRVCPNADAATQDALSHEGRERSGFFYDACKLSRYESVVERETFVALHGYTGVTVLLELAETLQGAGVSPATAESLVRELVLQSGLTPQQPPKLLLPAGEGQPVPRYGFAVAFTSDGISAGAMFEPLEPLSDPADLLDILMEEAARQRQTSERSGQEIGPFVLMAHRDTTAAEVAALLATFERAEVGSPRLLVLSGNASVPFAVRTIPDLSSDPHQTLAELVRQP